jgi:hemerythrin-like domain-containing protein/quercetin dioxygenase-like cupin family protein
MTDCCELLIAEHRRAEALLARLDTGLRQMVERGDPAWPALPEMQALYQTLASDLQRHYAIEEQALFPVLSQYRSMMLMEVEHEDLLVLQDAFAQHLSGLKPGEPNERAEPLLLLKKFQAYQDRLLAHIVEEERGIFPFANQTLEPEEKLKVLRLTHALVEATDPKVYDLVRLKAGFVLKKAKASASAPKPMAYDTLFEREHNVVQTLRLQAGQKQALHWAGQTQFILVLSGELRFETQGTMHEVGPGDTLEIDSRLFFALSALTEVLMLVVKVWPHPHYTKG